MAAAATLMHFDREETVFWVTVALGMCMAYKIAAVVTEIALC